jgi:hypothetical protein
MRHLEPVVGQRGVRMTMIRGEIFPLLDLSDRPVSIQSLLSSGLAVVEGRRRPTGISSGEAGTIPQVCLANPWAPL